MVRTAHASLALNGETVSVLRIIGGGDGVIARAFASHTLMVTLRSCLLGIFWALVILAAIAYGGRFRASAFIAQAIVAIVWLWHVIAQCGHGVCHDGDHMDDLPFVIASSAVNYPTHQA